MLNNIKGIVKIYMTPSYAFKSVVALSTGYVASKIVDHFSVCKQEDTKMKELDIKKEIAFKELDIKKEIAFKELDSSLITKK
jgi:hypothetical protein